jgi:hypothetical protein
VPKAAHDLVEDQQHTVAIADLADFPGISRHRFHAAAGRADHGFGYERNHAFWPGSLAFGFQRVGQPRRVGVVGLALQLSAISETRIDMPGLGHDLAERRTAPFVADDRQRPRRVAMIGLAPRSR